MEPVTITLIALGLTALLGGGTIAVKYDWNKVKKATNDKEFAFLGERRVGKSSLITYLRTGNVLDPDPNNYRPTLAPEKFIVKRSILEPNSGQHGDDNIEIRVKNGFDVGGLESAYPTWRKAVKTANIVVYLFRVDYVLQKNDEHLARIEKDASQIGKWIKEQSKKPSVYFVGTHCDLEKSVKFTRQGNAIEYQYDDIAKDIQVLSKAIVLAEAKTQVVVGSLKDNEGARGIISQVFKQISFDSE